MPNLHVYRMALAGLLGGVLLNGCSSGNYAPVVDIYGGGSRTSEPVTRGVHVVSAGETLYSIAWRYGWDFRALARANKISSPYTIFPGQQIRLDQSVPARGASSTAASAPPASQSPPKTSTASSGSAQTSRPPAASSPAASTGPLSWQWPASGALLRGFASNKVGQQGILIGGSAGDPVKAAEGGVVVYRGNGLTGYGNLLIVKHNETWLSAYAHNDRMLVKEGEAVKAGQQIATLGDTGTNRMQLHFEIRRNGTPVDPMGLLPKR